MPPITGVNFIVQVGNDQQSITLSGGGGTDTYTLTHDGQKTAAIIETATAVTVQSALEALSNLAVGDVVVTGAAGGPYVVSFPGNLRGQEVATLIAADETGTLVVTIVDLTPTSFTLLGGQRGGTLSRGTDEADTTSKDSSGFHEGLPIIRNWSIDFDALAIEGQLGYEALEDAYFNNRKVKVRVQTPAGNNYDGDATLTDWSVEGPHDDAMTASGTLTGATALTKT